MTLRNEDRDWIKQEIRTAIGNLKPHGWHRLIFVLREFGPIVGTCALVVALIGILVTVLIFSVSGRSTEAEFRGKTSQRLDSIESRLAGIDGTLKILQGQFAVQKYSAMPLKELKTHASELKQSKTELASVPRDLPNFGQRVSRL